MALCMDTAAGTGQHADHDMAEHSHRSLVVASAQARTLEAYGVVVYAASGHLAHGTHPETCHSHMEETPEAVPGHSTVVDWDERLGEAPGKGGRIGQEEHMTAAEHIEVPGRTGEHSLGDNLKRRLV